MKVRNVFIIFKERHMYYYMSPEKLLILVSNIIKGFGRTNVIISIIGLKKEIS